MSETNLYHLRSFLYFKIDNICSIICDSLLVGDSGLPVLKKISQNLTSVLSHQTGKNAANKGFNNTIII